ncbi:efflux RND transporter periplasmic adaptor subunit [Rubeoparvulum massiliense]|uniref:efflux RND transporter periplasmic adaptor subunit n=1 Tax=Rubeoparvulum massiliense TaxID=1631346 RepID=UPI00065E4951|nr:efflux RND transporter periplasmic adaptor subunit [Rubeoparvulum massiliense]
MAKRLQIIILCLLLITIVSGCSDKADTEEEETAIPVMVAKAVEGSLGGENKLIGTIEARTDVTIIPEVTGRLKEILVKEGDWVEEGTPLARLDQEIYQHQIDQASAGLLSARENTQSNIARAQTGVEQARQQYQKASEALAELQNRYDQGENVTEENIKQARDQAELAALSLQDAEKSLHAANEAGAAQVRQAQTSYELAQRDLGNTMIKAPVSGRIVSLTPSIGDMVSPQLGFGRIVDSKELDVTFSITEAQLSMVKEGQNLTVAIGSLGKEVEGKVLLVTSATNPQTRTFTVKIAITNEEDLIKPGMMAEIALEDPQELKGVVIPTEALKEEDGKKLVYVVQENRASLREVEVIDSSTLKTVVKSGVKAGELVVFRGQYELEDQALVRFQIKEGE